MHACRVVLVRPHYPGNIGATARVMGNMGLGTLVLVEPACDPLDPAARQMATHGEPILLAATIVPTLAEAIADTHLALATSANVGGLFRRQTIGPPEAILPGAAERLHKGERVAIVFGPEPTGLTNSEVALCQNLIHIPTSDTHTSLNLAQAVAIVVYELRKAWLAGSPAVADVPTATVEQHERMFAHLRRALEAIHFLYGDKAEPLMHGFRHLLGKARLTEMETKLLHGLARQILWYAEKRRRLDEE